MTILLRTMTSCAMVLLIAAGTADATEADASFRAQEQCIALIDQQTAALVAEDWPALYRFANEYVSDCSALDQPSLSDAHHNVAYALARQDRPAEALAAAAQCIEVNYRNSSCHLRKAQALSASGRGDEARSALAICLKLTAHNLDTSRRELARPSSGLDRELAESRVELFESELAEAEAFSAYLDSQQAIINISQEPSPSTAPTNGPLPERQ